MTETDYVNLAASWITLELADQAMLRRVDSLEGRKVIGQKGNRDCAGVLIPYYWPGEPRPFSYRLRRDNPDWVEGEDGIPKARGKYLGPPKSSNRLYIPPGITAEQLQDVTIPIVITEGEKKALALWRLACHETEAPRFVPVAISGVWSWRATVGKSNGPRGGRIDVKGPIIDFGRLKWKAREVSIIFDANVGASDSVKLARESLGRELTARNVTNVYESTKLRHSATCRRLWQGLHSSCTSKMNRWVSDHSPALGADLHRLPLRIREIGVDSVFVSGDAYEQAVLRRFELRFGLQYADRVL